MCIRRFAIGGLRGSTIFFHIVIKDKIFGKKNYWQQNVCFDFHCNFFSEIFHIIWRTEVDMIKIYIGLHVKLPLVLRSFNENWMFLTDFRIILKYQNFMEIPAVGVEFFHADGRMDMMKLIVTFRSFAKSE